MATLESLTVTGSPGAEPLGLLDRLLKRMLEASLRDVKGGSINLVDSDGTRSFGAARASADLRVTVHVHDPAFYSLVAGQGIVGAGQAYIEGMWSCDNLTDLIRIMARNAKATENLGKGLARIGKLTARAFALTHRNTLRGSRKNIAAHYDLGNDLFENFLDPTLTYSSAIFTDADMTLEEAQRAKYERICRKLGIDLGDHVIEIGTGWGGFAMHAASYHGCKVTTTTISQEQYDLATERIRAAGLDDRVEVLLEDYRNLEGQYDALVSIEMIEAVGHENMEGYFAACAGLLKEDGVACIQAIVNPDQMHEESKTSVEFIKRYIFPGGSLPSVWSMCDAVKNATDFRMTHLEDITPHYAETLKIWRAQMFENLERIRTLGYGEDFLRMWEFYLCYCEGAFHERYVGTVQAVFEKPFARRDSLLGALAPARAV